MDLFITSFYSNVESCEEPYLQTGRNLLKSAQQSAYGISVSLVRVQCCYELSSLFSVHSQDGATTTCAAVLLLLLLLSTFVIPTTNLLSQAALDIKRQQRP